MRRHRRIFDTTHNEEVWDGDGTGYGNDKRNDAGHGGDQDEMVMVMETVKAMEMAYRW